MPGLRCGSVSSYEVVFLAMKVVQQKYHIWTWMNGPLSAIIRSGTWRVHARDDEIRVISGNPHGHRELVSDPCARDDLGRFLSVHCGRDAGHRHWRRHLC